MGWSWWYVLVQTPLRYAWEKTGDNLADRFDVLIKILIKMDSKRMQVGNFKLCQIGLEPKGLFSRDQRRLFHKLGDEGRGLSLWPNLAYVPGEGIYVDVLYRRGNGEVDRDR